MDEERLISLETKIDRLLAALDKFGPLLDRLLAGKSIIGAFARTSPFKGGPHNGQRTD